MARTNYRDVSDRFSHIDAEFESCSIQLAGGQSHYAVKFYPWWEHPQHIRAIRDGTSWGFSNTMQGQRLVIVYPLGLTAAHVRQRLTVTDWSFHEDHPILWDFQSQSQIFCNSDLSIKDLINRLERNKALGCDRNTLYQYIDPLRTAKPPFSLGLFPPRLQAAVVQELKDMRVSVYVDDRLPHDPPLKLLLIDGEDFLIANDFELEVPDFEHKAEWFTPDTHSR